MNRELRRLLEKRGLSSDATEEEAWSFFERTDLGEDAGGTPSPEASATTQQSARERYQAEQEAEDRARKGEIVRQKEIRALGREWGLETLAEKLCDDADCSVDEARGIFLDRIKKLRDKDPELNSARGVIITEDERDKFRAHASDALTFRCGMPVEGYEPRQSELSELKLPDLARECLRMAGLPTRGQTEEILKRAMTTSDLSNILANVQNKFLFRGWQEAGTTWQIWCDTGSIPDYKQAEFPRASAFPDLTQVNANNGEYTYAYIGDAKEVVTMLHWGKLLGISLMSLANDDLGALSEVPMRMGQAANRTVDKYVYQTVLTSNSGTGETMGDTNNLFDTSNHANYVASGSGGAVAIATLDALAVLMENQMDSTSTAFVGESPRYVLCNSYYRFALTNILVGTNPNQLGDAITPVYNPWSNIVPVFTPQITTNSKKWWAIAGSRGNTVRVFGKNGEPVPRVDDQPGWSTAGWEYKVTLDFVAKALDWVFLAANYGS